MPMILDLQETREYDTLVDILREAETSEERLRQQIALPERTSYLAMLDNKIVGGATLQRQQGESELIYIAILPALQGRGYGKALIRAIFQQMQRGHTLLVGTGNTSLSNIAFYQKCGFRMDHVRRDYFSYAQSPVWENGLLLQDMLMFRYTRS